MMTPRYKNLSKRGARAKNVEIYRKLTGKDEIPSGRQYWTLCNSQVPRRSSEIQQLLDADFLDEKQFVGVDTNRSLVERNREKWPAAEWHVGRFTNVVTESRGSFKPGCVYYDSDGELSPVFWEDVRRLIGYCPAGVVLFVNGLLKNPRGRNRKAKKLSEITEVFDLQRDGLEVVEDACYSYTNKPWVLGTYVLMVTKDQREIHLTGSVRPSQSVGSKRAWQNEALPQMSDSENFMLVAPCGSGKTHVLSSYAAAENRKVVVAVPQTHISNGFGENFEEFSTPHIVLSGKNGSVDRLKSVLKGTPCGKDRKLVTTHSTLAHAWGSGVKNLSLVIDEAHHVGKDANKLGKIVGEILSGQPKNNSKVVLATATPFRHDRSPIIPDEAKFGDGRFDLDYERWFPDTGIEEIRTKYVEYGGDAGPKKDVLRAIKAEPGNKHLVVIPKRGEKWRRGEYQNALRLVSYLARHTPKGLRFLDLVTSATQKANKARLLSGEPFDVVVTCMLGREGTDWVPCDRIHHTAPENSLPMALQTVGRALRECNETTKGNPEKYVKKDVEVTYYVHKFPKNFKREDLSNHTNALVASMLLIDLLEPLKVPTVKVGPGRKREHVQSPLRELTGNDLWIKMDMEITEAVEGIGDDKDKIYQVVDDIVKKYELENYTTFEDARQRIMALVMRKQYPSWNYVKISDLMKDPAFDIVQYLGRSLYGASFGHRFFQQMKDALSGGEEQRRKRIAELIAWMDANGRRAPYQRGKGEERSLGTFLSQLRQAKSGKIVTTVLYGFEEEELTKAGYPGILNGVDREQERRDRIREVCRWMDANGRKDPSAGAKGEEERSLGKFISRMRTAKTGKGSLVLYGFEEEEFAKAGYPGILNQVDLERKRRDRIRELVAWMDDNGRKAPSDKAKVEEERSLGKLLTRMRAVKTGKGSLVLYGFEEEELTKAGYPGILNGVDREQERRDRIREVCRWMDANGRKSPSTEAKGEKERSLGQFLSHMRRAKSEKGKSAWYGFEEEEFAKAGYRGILEPRGGK